jgi:hypothetical protein
MIFNPFLAAEFAGIRWKKTKSLGFESSDNPLYRLTGHFYLIDKYVQGLSIAEGPPTVDKTNICF